MNVVVAERETVRQSQLRHELGGSLGAALQGSEKSRYLVAYLVACLVDRRGGSECVENRFQHERDERCARALRGTLPDGSVVIALAGMDQTFDGDVGEQGLPPGKDQRLPEPSHPAVAVLEVMNELELVVVDAPQPQIL